MSIQIYSTNIMMSCHSENTILKLRLTYQQIVGKVNDNVENIFHKKGQAHQKPYHSNSNAEIASIGPVVETDITIHFICYASKHYNRTQLEREEREEREEEEVQSF